MRPRALPALAAAALLLVTGVSFFALSASNAVSGGRLDQVSASPTPNDLKPAGCGSLDLSSIVLVSGNGTVTASNALVLATPGSDTIKDKGRNNCIVGGGGQDHVNADPSDICIVGPDPGARYRGCVTA